MTEFCSCTDYNCPNNPVNHEEGCDRCVEKCLNQNEIPACFFHKAEGLPADDRKHSFSGFARYVEKQQPK